LHRVLRWRRGVVDEDDDRLAGVGELAVEPLVSVLVAEDPAAVEMEHHRQDADGSGGADDPDADLPGRPARDDPVVDVGGLKLDGDACLNVAQELAGVFG
jgi:hypothetical protein